MTLRKNLVALIHKRTQNKFNKKIKISKKTFRLIFTCKIWYIFTLENYFKKVKKCTGTRFLYLKYTRFYGNGRYGFGAVFFSSFIIYIYYKYYTTQLNR